MVGFNNFVVVFVSGGAQRAVVDPQGRSMCCLFGEGELLSFSWLGERKGWNGGVSRGRQ